MSTKALEKLQKYTTKKVPLKVGRKPVMVDEVIVEALEIISKESDADVDSMIGDALDAFGFVDIAKALKGRSTAKHSAPASQQNGDVASAHGSVASEVE